MMIFADVFIDIQPIADITRSVIDIASVMA